TGPESIQYSHVRVVQLLCPRSPESLTGIVQVPCIEIHHLRTLDRNDPADLTGFQRPCLSRPYRNNELLDDRSVVGRTAETSIERFVDRQWGSGRGFVKWMWHAPLLF